MEHYPDNLPLAVTPVLVSKMKGMYKLNKYSYMFATVCRLMVAVAGYLGSVPLMLLFTVLTPNEVQENMEPSIRLPLFK